MPTTEQCRLVASISLGMPAAEARGRLRAVGLPGSLEGFWAIKVDAAHGSVNSVMAESGFSPDVELQGVCIGMPHREYYRSFAHRLLVPGMVRGTGVVGSFLSSPEQGWEMIVECDVSRGVYRIALMTAGLFRDRAPKTYATMIARDEQQRRDEAHAIATAGKRREAHARLIAVNARLATIGDADELLDYWARHASRWSTGEDDPDLVRYAEWLRAGDPDRWHGVAESWNWDAGIVPLRWIVSQPDCDAATALTVFYLGEPESQPHDTEPGRLLAAIRERWVKQGFSQREIQFRLPPYVARYPADRYAEQIPGTMRCSLPGREVELIELDEGFPVALRIEGIRCKSPG